ncbi:hypothetical protein GGF50DRAFT_60307 [Schizophyllum commune]
MRLSEALIHDERNRHIENVRKFARVLRAASAGDGRSAGPAPSSSPQPVPIPTSSIPLFEPLQGPQLDTDNPLVIYDDFDGIWLPSEGPRDPTMDVDEADDESDPPFDDMPDLLYVSDSSDSESDMDSDDESSDTESSLDTEEQQEEHPVNQVESAHGSPFDNEPHTPMSRAHRAQHLPSSSPAMPDHARPEDFDSDDGRPASPPHAPHQASHQGASRLPHPEHWWPWDDREAALGAQMSGFPRSVFSEQDLKTALWLAEQCGAPVELTLRQIKLRRDKVAKEFAPKVDDCDGSLGNPYSMINIADILADEWANPYVRPHVSVLGEDTGERLTAPCNGDKWLKEVDAILSGPMVCGADGQHYYVCEPALANTGDDATLDNTPHETLVMPTRWFTRNGEVWARAKHLTSLPDEATLFIDDREDCVEIPLTAFVASFPKLKATYHYYNIPDPSTIGGSIRRPTDEADDSGLLLVDRSSALHAPHPLRIKARGRQIFSVPIWVYCDDTSGNSSKKWNKHNSILFTLAGLPPRLAHLLYNIHFLSTSNLAAPLEMFEQLVKSVKEIREQGGIEAYDCHLKTVVLLLPWVLGMAGDNPMQSEFSSHIGLTGKCFCRVCNVRGADSKARPGGDDGERERVADSMFRDSRPPRSKEETILALDEQLRAVMEGAPTRASTLQTDTGIKDKYFMHFFEKLADECARIKDTHKTDETKTPQDKHNEVLAAIRALRVTLPDELYSPTLRLEEFDPARDTPVEILHVVLLGFVKYFWRDAVSRLNREQKEALKARIDSFNASGLGVPQPRGQTLVQWAGSLTGRDFRLILQMAPTILAGLLPTEVYEAWLALCRLAPLAFQAGISSKSDYFRRLEEAVYDFLACSALWTTQWFNKPKFHSFESYNFVIRLRSIHSPRHAPSADIARSFSNMHLIRHLASSGYVRDPDGTWRSAGIEIIKLRENELYAKLVGLSELLKPQVMGTVCLDRKRPSTTWRETLSSAVRPSPPRRLREPSTDIIRYCRKVILSNKDELFVGAFALYWGASSTAARPHVGKVIEILASARHVLGLLIEPYDVGDVQLPYRMPSLRIHTKKDSSGNDFAAPAEWCTISKCIAAVNTFHNCAKHQCRIARTRQARRERRLMQEKIDEVVHATQPEDLILNLSQLRSAESLHAFRWESRYPDAQKSQQELVDEAVQHRKVVDAEKLTKSIIPPGPNILPTSATIRSRKRRAHVQHGRPAPTAKRARHGKAAASGATPSHMLPAPASHGYVPPASASSTALLLPPPSPFFFPPSTPTLAASAARRAAQNRPAHLTQTHTEGPSTFGYL